MNPRPKTINLGFYILIPNFKIGRSASFRMDAYQCSLKSLTVKDQAPLKAVLHSRRPDLNLQEGNQEDGSGLYAATA